LHSTESLEQVDSVLARINLDPISPSDFENPENREIFRVWRKLADNAETPSLERLSAALPTQLHSRLNALSEPSSLFIRDKKWLLEAQVDPEQDAFDLQPADIVQDLVNSLLKLREQNLLRRNTEIRFLLEDAEESELKSYQQATAKTITALSQLRRVIGINPARVGDTLLGGAQNG
jgi:hypothetical protein